MRPWPCGTGSLPERSYLLLNQIGWTGRHADFSGAHAASCDNRFYVMAHVKNDIARVDVSNLTQLGVPIAETLGVGLVSSS